MLKVEGISKTFSSSARRVDVLSDIDIDLPSGMFFTLLGASGCGKTTLLRCVAGLERPDAGRLSIDGKVVFDGENPRSFVAAEDRPIGMVFQSYAIWPHMTVGENAAYSLKYGRYRPARSEIPALVTEMLEKLRLDALAKRNATELSGGQQQRLALARALLSSPKLLLLDEPLSNLDSKLRVSLRSELKRLQRETGVTTLYVTHDVHEAMSLSDMMAVMNDGRIEQVGTPDEIYSKPRTRFVASFVGETNLLTGLVSADRQGADLKFGRVVCEVGPLTPDREVTLTVRPEDVLVKDAKEVRGSTADNTFVGRVARREYLGEYVHLVVDVGQAELSAKISRNNAYDCGDSIAVVLPAAAIYPIAQETTSEEHVHD